MRAFLKLNANSTSNWLLRNITISTVAIICVTAVTGALGSQAVASTWSSDSLRPHTFSHKKHLNPIRIVAGTSTIYLHSMMLPKTEHFIQPIIKAKAIVGTSSMVCTPSGLGHRSTCGTSY